MDGKITLAEFREKVGFTERRKLLLEALDREISSILIFGSCIQIFVFGSFLTDKPDPNDIDLLVCGMAKKPFEKYQEVCPGLIQVKSSFSVMGHRPYSRDEIVSKFNNNAANIDNNICLNEENVAELLLDSET